MSLINSTQEKNDNCQFCTVDSNEGKEIVGNHAKERVPMLLKRLFQQQYDAASPEQNFDGQEWKQLAVRRIEKGNKLLQWGFPSDTVLFMLGGTAQVVVSSFNGQMIVVDSMKAPHLFGAIETIRKVQTYLASVVAAEDCCVVAVPAEEFLFAANHHIESSRILLKYMVWLASISMDKTELGAIVKPKEMLLRYLYQHSRGQMLPYVIPATRKAVSEELHINLRTLYRYLDDLKDSGFIQLEKGKIRITTDNFHKLREAHLGSQDLKSDLCITWE